MNGTLFDKTDWVDLYGAAAGASGCGPPIYSGEGSGNGSTATSSSTIRATTSPSFY